MIMNIEASPLSTNCTLTLHSCSFLFFLPLKLLVWIQRESVLASHFFVNPGWDMPADGCVTESACQRCRCPSKIAACPVSVSCLPPGESCWEPSETVQGPGFLGKTMLCAPLGQVALPLASTGKVGVQASADQSSQGEPDMSSKTLCAFHRDKASLIDVEPTVIHLAS